jgi:long-chain acyl-CoA synthetase
VRFALFDKELHADDGELTRTQKVRRTAIAEKYHDMIAGLYGAVAPSGVAVGDAR